MGSSLPYWAGVIQKGWLPGPLREDEAESPAWRGGNTTSHRQQSGVVKQTLRPNVRFRRGTCREPGDATLLVRLVQCM